MMDNIIYGVPILPLRGLTIFPDVLFHFDVGRKKSVKALEKAMSEGQRIFLVSQRDSRTEKPQQEDLHKVGTYCVIRQILKIPGDSVRVLVEGSDRAVLLRATDNDDCLCGDVEIIKSVEPSVKTMRDTALLRNAQDLFVEYMSIIPKTSSETILNIMESESMGYVADYIAQNVQLKQIEKQKVLEQINVRKRLSHIITALAKEIEILELEIEMQDKVREQIDKNQRDYYIREQVRVLNEELGDGEDVHQEYEDYLNKIVALGLPEEHTEKLLKQAKRLSTMQSSSPESGVIRTYLDTCLDLPWKKTTKEINDIKKASAILEKDHYGLDKVKERILEFFAVKTLSGGVKGQIICLAGPPGVGKTSVARSVARSMGRNYVRISLGGVRDEADIRGHRKTYIGAMPGRIITALQQAKSCNCLMLIDEIDKLGSDHKGDPSSALLEVFDTEQNVEFRDHFIELPFDLSDVLFITTANDVGSIPRPLLDRMELIELPGYTDEEKAEIAVRHLIPKQIKKHGLRASEIKISPDALRLIITGYTREAGVRELERQIARLCRKAAKVKLESGVKSLTFTAKNLNTYLGVPKFKPDNHLTIPECGVVNGLAWTQSGGDMLEVECSVIPGTGKLVLTGNLGEVMKESAQAALTYLRSRREEFELPENFHKERDIHIHFPEGAVPKDGPSAGITTCTAIYSALKGSLVDKSFAMTGEISLRGRVLPIGGLKEKSMAAYRNGITKVIIPAENQPDLEDIDKTVLEKLSFYPVQHMDQVIDLLFPTGGKREKIAYQAVVIPPATAPTLSIRQ